MFSSWEGFLDRLIQIYGDLEVTTTAERKLLELTQKGLATDYTTMFQTYAIQTEWNQDALMARYKQGLKSRVQDALIYMQDAENIRDLINQAVKIDNRLY